MAAKKARVLSTLQIDGITYPVNSVIVIDERLIKGNESLDSHPDAVGYCENELGIVAVKHSAKDKAEV